MKAVIVDDEMDGIRTLQKMLAMHCPQVQVTATFSNAVTAAKEINAVQPDLLFLDIQMPGKTGLELLSELSPRNFEVVFVTAYNEYMLQALQFSAVDYLLKPVDEDRLVEAVERAGRRLQEGKKEKQADTLLYNIEKAGKPLEMRLCLPTFKGFLIVKLEDIIYCEAERSYTIFHLSDGKTLMVSKPLLEYDNLLKDAGFFRIHKSFLINLVHVREYHRGEGGFVVMNNKAELEVTRRKKEMFLEQIKTVFKN